MLHARVQFIEQPIRQDWVVVNQENFSGKFIYNELAEL